MRPDLVVDIGNSRVKWGRCADGAVADSASLPHDDPAAWQSQLVRWGLTGTLGWVISGVHPRTRDRLADWVRGQGDSVRILGDPRLLSLQVRLERPDHVGIDRLLNAMAANTRRRPGAPAAVVDAGSAVTVDFIDGSGAFAGGAIFPGLRLMVRALHDYTALLPLIQVQSALPPLPGVSTPAAMEAGVYWAVAGGIQACVRRLGSPAEVFLTGGDAALLHPALGDAVTFWPHMTLEGIRLSAEALP